MPEAAVAVSELSNPRMLHAAEWLERKLYESAAAITTATEPFKESIAAKIGEPDKVNLLLNRTTKLYLDAAELNPDRGALGLAKDKFIWTYAGNVGLVQGLEAAIDAAALLGDSFQLLILGDGPVRRKLEERAKDLRAGSVVFRDQVQPKDVVYYLRASDALLVSLAADPVLEKFVPSKLYGFCAVARAVIVAAAGEAHRLAVDEKAALAASPGDPVALAAAVGRLRDDGKKRAELARASQAFAAQNLRDVQTERLLRVARRGHGGGVTPTCCRKLRMKRVLLIAGEDPAPPGSRYERRVAIVAIPKIIAPDRQLYGRRCADDPASTLFE